jgi:TolA-binding protein
VPNLAEVRAMITLRDAQGRGDTKGVVESGRAYLGEFPDGKYADEALLAVGEALAAREQPEEALAVLNRLVAQHPDSPFVEQALVESLPLLVAAGKEEEALARVDTLAEEHPRSLQRNGALLWKAGRLQERGDFDGTLAALRQVNADEGLSEAEDAAFYRLQILALVKKGQSAWDPLQRYLRRKDTPEHKAEVLMLVGEIARKAERPNEALRYYRQVVEDFPVPAHLGEALYWRAELFQQTRLEDAPEEVRAARRETAIGYYAAYLGHGHRAHAAAAHLGRGRLHRAAGRLAEALADYERAVALHPDYSGDATVIRERVELFKGLERPEEAMALLEAARQAAGLSPAQHTVFQVELATLYYEGKRCEEVERLLNPMPIIADPAVRPRAFFMRGFCRYQHGDWEKATFDLEGLINDPNYQELALAPLLDAYEMSGQASRLVNLGEELLSAGRVKPSETLFLRLAGGYEQLGEPALMLSAFQRLEILNPEATRTPEIQFRMGKGKEALGRQNEAITHYTATLALLKEAPPPPLPMYFEVLERLGALYLEQQRYQEVGALLSDAEQAATTPEQQARLKRSRRDLNLAWGRGALAAGDVPKALEKGEAALADSPPEDGERRGEAVALLVTAYGRSKEPDEGLALYRHEMETLPDEAARTRLTLAVLAGFRKEQELLLADAHRGAAIAVYKDAVEALPAARFQERYETARFLDRLYAKERDFAARAALVTLLLKDGLDEPTKDGLRLYQSQIYKEWARALIDRKEFEAARFQAERGLALLAGGDWRQRYELVSLLSRVHLEAREYTELVLENEALLSRIEDEALTARLRHFLGQVYLEWGKAADADQNVKSARIRYYRALDYLPPEDWQRRLAAAAGLGAALLSSGYAGEAAQVYETVLPQVQDSQALQPYALYLGRLYGEQLKSPEAAGKWLRQADLGDSKPLSLEAGYLVAELHLDGDDPGGALQRLQELTTRDIAGSRWEVPIHYRIAILLHQQKKLPEALAHYKRVAAVKNEEARRLYPRSIRQSEEQVRQIEAFLKTSGGKAGEGVAVPRVSPE